MIEVLHGDCCIILPTLKDEQFHSCVTDPPYGLSFMAKKWDDQIAFRPETWAEVYRVLKPGAHLAAFGGTRTFHRLVCAIEDAGFEIRDTICWLYGSGFPKSMNVSKAIDATLIHGDSHSRSIKLTNESRPGEGRFGGALPNNGIMSKDLRRNVIRDEANTREAAEWSGFGTALKPACELICLARKPLIGTVVANVLAHGTGALNIDACRVGTGKNVPASPRRAAQGPAYGDLGNDPGTGSGWDVHTGRWPANCVHDGSAEVLAAFAEYGKKTSGAWNGHRNTPKTREMFGAFNLQDERGKPGDSGSASRFFYTSKADRSDRADSKHPTVKPVDLMRWLVTLVTPTGGHILDPFAGSGTTGEACMLAGFDCTLIEREAEHAADIRHRIERWSGLDAPLFAEDPAK